MNFVEIQETPSVKINVQGARGQSFADVMRRTGQYGVLPSDTDAQVITKVVQAVAGNAQEYVDLSQYWSEISESWAVALSLAAAGTIYDSLAAGAAAVAEGESFLVDDGSGRLYFGRKVGGVGVMGAEIITSYLYKQRFFTDLGGMNIPAAIVSMQTIGYNTVGIGPAKYVYDSSLNDDYVDNHPRSSFMSQDGRVFRINEDIIDAKMLGAKAGEHSTDAITETMKVTYERGGGKCTLYKEVSNLPYWIDGEGKTDPDNPDDTYQRGVIPIFPGVIFESDGATLKIVGTHTKNPPGIFGHHYWLFQDVSGAGFTGRWNLNGNAYDGERNPTGVPYDNGFQSGSFVEADVYQSQIGIVPYRAQGDFWLGDIRGDFFRGDVVSAGIFGDADGYIGHLHLESLYCDNIFREGIGIFNVHNASIGDIYLYGNGYWVAGVDIERHLAVDVVRNIHIRSITADFRTGRSPEERTPLILDPSDREEARRTMRRIVSCIHQYDGFPDDKFDGKSMNIQIDRIIGIQANMDIFNYSNVRYGVVDLTMPLEEDLTGHTLIDENGGSCDAIRCAGLTFVGGSEQRPTGLYGVSFQSLRIEGYYAHGFWGVNYSEINIPDGTVIKGTKKSPMRFDECGGTIGKVLTQDCGLPSANVHAVEVWGSGADTLYIDGVVAKDTRSGANRTMLGTVRAYAVNSDKLEVINTRGVNTINDELLLNVDVDSIQYANMKVGAPVFEFSMPTKIRTNNSDLDVQGNLIVGDGVNDAGLAVKAGAGNAATISWLIGNTLQYQIVQTATGFLNFNQFDGPYVRNDISITENGDIRFPSATYQHPLNMNGGRLWGNASGRLYTKQGANPSGENDGTPL